jgi:hypothetical protein
VTTTPRGRVLGEREAEESGMKKRGRAGERDTSVVVMECAAFLDGTLAEYWDERGMVVPVWAWTNLLAHGSRKRIGKSVIPRMRPRRAGRSWRIARSFLAYEVLAVVERGVTLDHLQSSVLIPLELEMAVHPEVAYWSPRRWVDAVDYAIRTQRITLEL